MAENIKQRGLNVTVTFDDEKLREIVDDLIINQGLEQVVHCKDCINVCRVGNETQLLCQNLADRRGHYLNPNGYCSYGERRE